MAAMFALLAVCCGLALAPPAAALDNQTLPGLLVWPETPPACIGNGTALFVSCFGITTPDVFRPECAGLLNASTSSYQAAVLSFALADDNAASAVNTFLSSFGNLDPGPLVNGLWVRPVFSDTGPQRNVESVLALMSRLRAIFASAAPNNQNPSIGLVADEVSFALYMEDANLFKLLQRPPLLWEPVDNAPDTTFADFRPFNGFPQSSVLALVRGRSECSGQPAYELLLRNLPTTFFPLVPKAPPPGTSGAPTVRQGTAASLLGIGVALSVYLLVL